MFVNPSTSSRTRTSESASKNPHDGAITHVRSIQIHAVGRPHQVPGDYVNIMIYQDKGK